jgi:hypothetical protein
MKAKRVRFPVALVVMLCFACSGAVGGRQDGANDGGSGTGARGWNSGTLVSNARNFFDYATFASDADVNESGVAVALWVEDSTSSSMDRLWSNVCRAGVWGAPTALGDLGSVGGSVAVMPNGDAMVLYVQRIFSGTNATSQRVQATRYLAASDTWTSGTPVSVDSATDLFPSEPSVAVDGLGNAIAVWSHAGQVWSRRYDASAGWSATVTQLSASPRSVYTPKIVLNGSNHFTAVWIEGTAPFDPSFPGGGPNKPTAHARGYVANWEADQRIGWASTELLGDFDSAGRMWVDANSAGSVFVVWEQVRTLSSGSFQHSLDAARFNPVTSAWSPPETIATHDAELTWPQVAVDNSGRALAIWRRPETSDGTSVRGSWFDTASGTWGTPELLDQTGTAAISDAVLAIDGAGNAELAWDEPYKGMVERRFSAAAGAWGSWNMLGYGTRNLSLHMSDTGYAVLIGDRLNMTPLPFTEEAWAWVYVP